MHHVVLERWSRRQSPVHARDARVKLLAVLTFLVALATTPSLTPAPAAGYAAFLVVGILLARLPVPGVLLRAAIVLPFSGVFGLISLLGGDTDRAAAIVGKSYLSALAVLLLVGSTPLPLLLRGLENLAVPRLLILVVQFMYRYLFVISEQGQHMRQAAQCRGSSRRSFWAPGRLRRSRFRAAAGGLAVLFARSYRRAEGIHRAMLSRGFRGRLTLVTAPRPGWKDVAFLAAAAAVPVALCLGAGGPL